MEDFETSKVPTCLIVRFFEVSKVPTGLIVRVIVYSRRKVVGCQQLSMVDSLVRVLVKENDLE